jgi:hypothetical protein
MFIFLFIYVSVFLIAIYNIFSNKVAFIQYFIIFALPIYITTLSVAFLYNLSSIIPFLQFTKEILVIIALGILVFKNRNLFILNNIDKLMLLYCGLVFVYVLLPIGPMSIYQKLVATKSVAFFPFVYFLGKLMPTESINIDKIFKLICLVAMVTAVILLFEVITNQNLQNYTGYTNFMTRYFSQDASGSFGLSWTFETDNGLKRFASLYSMPLEHAAATLITIAVILSLSLSRNNTYSFDIFLLLTLVASIFSILFALSRASLIGYMLIVYVYTVITKNKNATKLLRYIFLGVILLFVFSIKDDIKNFFLGTIMFTNSSSLTHMLAWTEAIFSIYSNPMGIGLGTIGNLVNSDTSFFGGENEFLIIGVQVGLLPMFLYLFIYYKITKITYDGFKLYVGKTKKLALFLFLVKIGMIIPLVSSEIESYIYISYLVWFLTGYYVNLVSKQSALLKIQLAND